MQSPIVQKTWQALATQALPDLRDTDLRRLPAPEPQLVEHLGRPLASLSLTGDIRLVVHFLSVILAGSGFFVAAVFVNVALEDRAPARPTGKVEMIAWASAFILGGLAFAFWISFVRDPNYALTIWILDDGIVWKRAGVVGACPWTDVDGLSVVSVFRKLTVSFVLPPGINVTLKSHGERDRLPVLEYIITKVSVAHFLPRLRRIIDGERVEFGSIELARDGIFVRKLFFPWTDIAEVASRQTEIVIEGRHRFGFHPAQIKDVAFTELVVAISEIMIEECGRLPPERP